MSIKCIKTFMEKMETDEQFAKEILADPNADAIKCILRGYGFKIPGEESDNYSGELTDDELSVVTGGQIDTAKLFLSRYCNGIPLQRARDECESILAALE